MSLFIERHRVNFGVLLQGFLAGIVVATGVLGQLSGSPNLAVWFGTLLCAGVVAHFNWGLWRCAESEPAAIASFSRHVNRRVYLLLYGLIGVKEIYSLGEAFHPLQAFQPYLASGLLAIILNHALASASLRRSASRKPPVRGQVELIAARTRELSRAANSSAWR